MSASRRQYRLRARITAADASGYSFVYPAFQVGDVVTLETTCEDETLSNAQWAGGVGDIMIKDGAVTDSSSWTYVSDGRQPRSALGMKADGTLVRVDSSGIAYRRDTLSADTTVWNTMETMTGMEYTLALADGSRVYMNAETRVTFPVDFRGAERRVRLVGEAYFEVACDEGRPFVVETEGVDVRVLGTSFNVRAYGDEGEVATTLVEGRVAVGDGSVTREIAPGEQATYVKADGRLAVRRVDVALYTAWRTGKFVFRNETLREVMGYLSRWYGFEYRFVDERAADARIGASMDRYEDMTPIIEMMRRTGLVNVTQVDNMLYISSAK